MHETLEIVQMRSRKIIDGNLKVYLALSSLFLVLVLGKFSQILAVVIFSVLCIYADWKAYLRIIRIPAFFLLGAMAVILFTIDGKVLASFWIFRITEESTGIAFSVLLRSTASLSILSFLIMTTSIPEFITALSKLKIPKFVVEMLMLVYRAIQILFEEISRLDTAASSRLGFLGFRNMIRTASLLAFSAFMKSLKRSEIMEEALESRCYRGCYPLLDSRTEGAGISALILSALFLAGWFG
ncbi:MULTISPECIES: cobalt ECF transporter T component CbiQ [unclassified Archaeoglobus]|jgi:cobalt/nickel transport system permease protein|uniref:cobalt ECF transporter T component CbiQ n=1 Tax=unclassified Archaeoglobus TaxID=2643606 RepID=UPI0025C2660B|nr:MULTISPECIES: cobalt ECF transporter T component CbiQ [unclassified Archaeoglobus]